MCCLFGFVDHGHALTGKQKTKLIHALATAAEERGTDAAGIAYNTRRGLQIHKSPVPGHALGVRIPDGTRVVLGHTRLATQGAARYNPNNHPFRGKTGGVEFALAHNGVINNDKRLRRELALPKTQIATDSYIAVQLLESRRALNFDALRYVAEILDGSFVFTVLDALDNLYLVRGDNPLTIWHWPDTGLIVYASTPSVLRHALLCVMFLDLKGSATICGDEGDMLKIDAAGNLSRESFKFIPNLLRYGAIFARSALEAGWSPDEIADYCYDRRFFHMT